LKKVRVYEAARQFNISSEALLEIIRSMDIPVKSHMSSITEDVVKKIAEKMQKEKDAVKQEYAEKRKREAKATKAKPKKKKGPSAFKPSMEVKSRPKPAAQQRHKKKRTVDEAAVKESVRKTLATFEAAKKTKRKRRRDDAGEAVEEAKPIRVHEFITVGELAGRMDVKPQDVLTTCLKLGILANINRRLDKDSVLAVADEHGVEVEFVAEYGEEMLEREDEKADENLQPRAPVVTIMGHVDHGKTSLLDYIRESNIIGSERGGITQHIGAYQVNLPGGQVTFLDTPGHEAFTAMRARGAQVTDIVVLVVAADDRVMPQTKEAIDHARAADVPIIVAINKMDLPEADPALVKQDLSKSGLVVEEWGGKTICVEISAKTGMGVEKLLEMILLQAEIMELKADPDRKSRGVVVESKMDIGRGVVGTVLVQDGKLEIGDPFVSGALSGRVKAMYDGRGRKVKSAGPSTPVEVLGWSGMPQAGDTFMVMRDDREARTVSLKRQQLLREQQMRGRKPLTLADLQEQIKEGEVGQLNLVLKGDVDGSVEAISDSLAKLSTDEVTTDIIRKGVGIVNEGDVVLAAASNAVVLAFHTGTDARAREASYRENVEIRRYDVIYDLVDDVKKALSGLLKPDMKEVVTGEAEVRKVFRLSRAGTVAGSYVLSGNIARNSLVRVRRDGEVVFEGKISSLKRIKDDVKQVASGFDCGIGLEGFDAIQEKDIIQAYAVEEIARTLE
jgi:translation initiation factor IF-2